MRALRELENGKDEDGNLWYRREWDAGYADDERANASEPIKENAVHWGPTDTVYAEEGYAADDPRRRPNLTAIPISKHVYGLAIDVLIEWEKLGGPWSDRSRSLIAQFGLVRPFVDEAWHLELDTDGSIVAPPHTVIIWAIRHALKRVSNAIHPRMSRVLRKLALSFLGLKQSRIKKYLPPGVVNALKVHNYHIWLLYDTVARKSNRDIVQAIRRLKDRKRILFYPDVPWEGSMIYQICLELGYSISNNFAVNFDLAFRWRSTTFLKPDPVLDGLSQTQRVVNIKCHDISKGHVEAVFRQVFGYSAAIDPLTFSGECVQKSNLNARHDGRIIDCPIKELDAESVYQIVIDNEVEAGWVRDIRVPIMGPAIPFVFLYGRPIDIRFSAVIARIQMVDTAEVFSEEEYGNILCFCETLGLDYGELDILRDKKDLKIYIVDANNTPTGPPIYQRREKVGVKKLAVAFEKTFMGPGLPRA